METTLTTLLSSNMTETFVVGCLSILSGDPVLYIPGDDQAGFNRTEVVVVIMMVVMIMIRAITHTYIRYMRS